MMASQPFEFPDDRRKYPRLRLDIPARIYYEARKYVAATIYDISPDGLQIRCDGKTALTLNPDGRQIKKKTRKTVVVKFKLHINDEQYDVMVECQTYYFVAIPDQSKKEIALGIVFKKFRESDGQYVMRFITDAMEPEESRNRELQSKPRNDHAVAEEPVIEKVDGNKIKNKPHKDADIDATVSDESQKLFLIQKTIRKILEKITDIDRRLAKLEKKVK